MKKEKVGRRRERRRSVRRGSIGREDRPMSCARWAKL